MNTKQNDLYFRKQLKFDAMKVKYFAVRVGNWTEKAAELGGLPQIVSLDLSGNDIAQFENNALPDLQTLNLSKWPALHRVQPNRQLFGQFDGRTHQHRRRLLQNSALQRQLSAQNRRPSL